MNALAFWAFGATAIIGFVLYERWKAKRRARKLAQLKQEYLDMLARVRKLGGLN